jgi:cysteinyl-tRNA synthetase
MARKYLGLPFDIHGGGLENIFPHNESEIAQSEAAYEGDFARYWLLNNMVTIDGVKMGKSLGNSLTVQQVLTGKHARLSQPYAPLAVRFFILSSHYRQTTDFTDEALKGASRGYERLIGTVASAQTPPAEGQQEIEFKAVIEQHQARFLEAMDHDFNTPQALAALFDFNRAVNTLINSNQPVAPATLKAIDETYRSLGGNILGIIPDELSAPGGASGDNRQEDLIRLLIELRAAARKNKDYATGDAIRNRLAEIGVVLEDKPDSTVWKITQ